MVDVAVASQLQQWTFEKPAIATRTERCSSGSTASSPNLSEDAPETLRINTSQAENSTLKPRKKSIVLQERYMSSEEDLSPADDGSDSEYDYEHVVVHDPAKECKARTMSISRWSKGRSCDMAVMVSYANVGRPKVIELDCRSPITVGTMAQQRSASLAALPIFAPSKLQTVDAASRLSMKPSARPTVLAQPLDRSTSPSIELESRRPSTTHSPITQKPNSSLHHTDSASTISSFQTAPSSRSTSPTFERPVRPATGVYQLPSSSRSSVFLPSQTRNPLSKIQTSRSSYRQSQWAPPTPSSPASHAFLSSDPYETSNTHSASPIIKPAAPHKRLRSISMKLALAKIAITPSSKKAYDARIHGGKAPPTPSTPYTPLTPQTAPLEGASYFSSPNKLRRASTILRPKSRHNDATRGPSPEVAPPVPIVNSSSANPKRLTRMVARGADEIEPTLVLPPCPTDDEDDPMANIKTRRLKKRKSLMSLMDSL